jgi:hypothetical protein
MINDTQTANINQMNQSMKKTVFIIALLLTFITVKADMGDPTIQAVCKVTLTNGESAEGYIVLGNGGYFGIWTNGFYFEQGENYKHPVLFSLAFKSIEKTASNTYEVNTGIEGGLNFKQNVKFFYMEWVPTPSISKSPKINYIANDSSTYLTVVTNLEKKYKLLDTLSLCLELPKSTYLNAKENVKQKKIAVKDIIKFELVDNPSGKWISEITDKTKNAQELYGGTDSSGDFWAASWYHDIIKDEVLFKQYQEIIIFNNKR